jgi:nitrite reductase (NO-forming)
LLAIGGMLVASMWATAAGLVCYAAGVAVAAVPLSRNAIARRPGGPAAWMMAASIVWLAVAVLLEAARLALAGSVDRLPDVVITVVPILVVGFTAQVLMGALTQLLPVVLGHGPAEHKAVGAQFDTVYREGAWLLRPSETAGRRTGFGPRSSTGRFCGAGVP